jgi:hypothetical protein
LRNSIWNLPLGENAQTVPAGLTAPFGTFRNIIIQTPNAPLTAVDEIVGPNRWNLQSCGPGNKKGVFSAPLPNGFVILEPSKQPRPFAWLLANGVQFEQGVPFIRCAPSDTPTFIDHLEQGSIRADGNAYGMHHSGLSALGGAIRLGELLEEAGAIRHVLKFSLPENALTPNHVWPARLDPVNKPLTGKNNALRIGSLLAIPRNKQLLLVTEPARSLAWTLQNFGGYVAHASPDKVRLFIEIGPAGAVENEFMAKWQVEINDTSGDFADDMKTIIGALHVVTNISEASYNTVAASRGTLGMGGGAPLTDWVAPLKD